MVITFDWLDPPVASVIASVALNGVGPGRFDETAGLFRLSER
jgi:hypothetical protein